MLDIQFIRENTEVVKQAAKNKNVDVDIDKLLKLDEQRRSLSSKADELRHQRNELSDKTKKPSASDIAAAKNVKEQLSRLEDQLKKVEMEFKELLYQVPNIPSDDTPAGKDESANKVLRKWGEPPKFDFKPKPNWELGKDLDVIDMERAAKVSGNRFAYLKGRLAELEQALFAYVFDVLTGKVGEVISQFKLTNIDRPFERIVPPSLLRLDVMAKTGRLEPAEDKYVLPEDKLILAGSAEQTVMPLHMDEVLAVDDLPLRYAALSTAFRRESGSYGKDVRGILRLHQFNKIELVSFSSPEGGPDEHQLMVAIQEYIMQQLEIPYQVVAISTGDMGKPDHKQTDIETWMPGQGQYRETHTADYNTDFQARRLNIKYRSQDRSRFVYTNDATAIADTRALIAIMENYQTREGKIKIPKVLQNYIKGSHL